MLKVIPRHSLVIVVGANADQRKTVVENTFDQHEIISAEKVSLDLVGDSFRPDLNTIVFSEIRRRTQLKIDLGERVVVNAANLKREDRMALAAIGTDCGLPVFYLICDPDGADPLSMSRFLSTERDLLRGDGLAEVIDWRIHSPAPVAKVLPDFETLRTRWDGVTVIGDVHGMHQSLLSAVSWARSRHHYMIFLGDVIDYGTDPLAVSDDVYRIVMRGEGEMILGNHERKIARWLSTPERMRGSVRLSDGNRVTTEAVDGLGALSKKRWIGRFRGLVSRCSSYRAIGNMVFAHAAMHPDYWVGGVPQRDLDSWALTGEYSIGDKNGSKPTPVFDWADAVPAHRTVFVGHNIRGSRPLMVRNAAGGTTVFLDTGSGKGGLLSSADLRFTDSGFKIENYNIY